LETLSYWLDRTGSIRYSKKLDGMFRSALRVIAVHPELGRQTSDLEVRAKGIGDHLLYYSFTETAINVLSIWHGKRDPKSKPF